MERKTYNIVQSVDGCKDLAQLMNRGRQMHDQAVFELLARLVSKVVYFVKGIAPRHNQKAGLGEPLPRSIS